MIPGAFPIPVANAAWRANAVTFDVNDFLQTSALTGIANGNSGAVSAWLKFAAGSDATEQNILCFGSSSSAFRLLIRRTSANRFGAFAAGSGATPATFLSYTSSTLFRAVDGWLHLLMSWKCNGTQPFQIYVNDVVPGTSVSSSTSGSINYANTPYDVGADSTNNTDTTRRLQADVAELMFDTSWIDLSVTANRRKFIDASLKPVDPGTDGSTAWGFQPLIYLKGPQGQFPSNYGSGGAFTLTGTLVDAATSPSD